MEKMICVSLTRLLIEGGQKASPEKKIRSSDLVDDCLRQVALLSLACVDAEQVLLLGLRHCYDRKITIEHARIFQ